LIAVNRAHRTHQVVDALAPLKATQVEEAQRRRRIWDAILGYIRLDQRGIVHAPSRSDSVRAVEAVVERQRVAARPQEVVSVAYAEPLQLAGDAGREAVVDVPVEDRANLGRGVKAYADGAAS